MSTQRRIETLMKMLFPPKSRSIIPADTHLDHFVQLMYIILNKFPDIPNDHFTNLLLDYDTIMSSSVPLTDVASSPTLLTPASVTSLPSTISFSSVSSTDSEDISAVFTSQSPSSVTIILGDVQLNPERLIIALRSFLLLLSDVESAIGHDVSESHSDLKEASSNPFAGFSFGSGGATSSSTDINTSRVIVQSKIQIETPLFPAPTLFDGGSDMARIVAMTMRKAPQSQQNDSGSLRGPALEFSVKSRTVAINGPFRNSVMTRLSPAVKDTLDKVSEVLGRVAMALDKGSII
jgi:hypothetical protein